MSDRWVELEKKHNRVPVEGLPNTSERYRYGFTCDDCGTTHISSMFLHRHVCPDDPRHRENYNMYYLERELTGTCGSSD